MTADDSEPLLSELQLSLRQAQAALESSREDPSAVSLRARISREIDLLSHLILIRHAN